MALDLRRGSGINVLLIKNQGGKGPLVNPTADYVIKEDDIAVVMGTEEDLSAVSDDD